MNKARLFAIVLLSAWVLTGCGTSETQTIVIDPSDASADSPPVETTTTQAPAPETPSDPQTDSESDPPPAATETPKPEVVINRPPVRSFAPPSDEEESQRVRPRSTIRRGGVHDLTFDDLEFDIKRDGEFKREQLGAKIEKLDGKPVIIRGFILAASVFQQSGIDEFVLVRDNQECCFGPGAYIFHNIQVDTAKGVTADFTIRPVTLQGKLTIKPWFGPDGRCYSVFHILADKVK